MRKYIKFLVCLILICIILIGCSKKEKPFIIPVNYTGELRVTVYTKKTQNVYNVGITCRNSNYIFSIDEGTVKWNMAFLDDKRCILNNDKFMDNSVTIDDFKIAESLVKEFDLSKFINSVDPIPEELIYWDGTYKHVLNFSKENLLPNEIFIYKNDNLVKAIQYNKINVE